VDQAVDVLEIALLAGRLHTGVVDALAVVRMHELEQPDPPFDEVLRHPARQVEDGIADENHLPFGREAAVEGHAGDIADQGAVLALAVLQRLLHAARGAHVRDKRTTGLARRVILPIATRMGSTAPSLWRPSSSRPLSRMREAPVSR